MRALFVNENLGGHTTLHRFLRESLTGRPDVAASFLDVPPPRFARRLAAAPLPGLARLDLDLQPLRYQLAQSAQVRRRLEEWADPVDVVHVYTHNATLLSAGWLAERPSVVALDGTNAQNGITLPYRRATRFTPLTLAATRRFEQRVYDAATLVVAQSSWAAASLRDDYGVPESRIRVVRYGVTVGPAPERVPTILPEITFVGTSMARKGGWRLLEVFRRRLAGRAVLNLVTLDPVLSEPGVRVFDDIRAGDGRIEAVLARTAVLAFPSEIDKSSYAVLEAMHAGVPVVACRVAGIPELVDDGVTGLLVEPGDDDALGDALEALLDDGARRAVMGAAARARVASSFDARRTTDELLAVLEEARTIA